MSERIYEVEIKHECFGLPFPTNDDDNPEAEDKKNNLRKMACAEAEAGATIVSLVCD